MPGRQDTQQPSQETQRRLAEINAQIAQDQQNRQNVPNLNMAFPIGTRYVSGRNPELIFNSKDGAAKWIELNGIDAISGNGVGDFYGTDGKLYWTVPLNTEYWSITRSPNRFPLDPAGASGFDYVKRGQTNNVPIIPITEQSTSSETIAQPEETVQTTTETDTTAFGLPAEWRNTMLQMSLGEDKQYNLTRPETSQRGVGGVGGSLIGAAVEGLSEGALREANRAATSYAGQRAFERDILPNIERVYGVDFTREPNASDLTQRQKDRLTRIAEQNPEREQRVLNRMLERAPAQFNPATSEFNAEQELAMRKRLMQIEDELIQAREARDEARQIRLMNEQARLAQQLYSPEAMIAQYTTPAQGTTAR